MDVHNQIRVLRPWPNAFTFLGGQRQHARSFQRAHDRLAHARLTGSIPRLRQLSDTRRHGINVC